MRCKNIFFQSILFLMIFAIPTFGQVLKELKIFKGMGPEIEILEDDNIMVPPLRGIIDRLDLSESQEKDFRKLHYDLQKKQTELLSKIKTARIELRELMDSDKIDRTTIEKKIRDISDLRLKMQLNRLDNWFAVNKILDEKQQKIWKEHFQFMDSMRMHGFPKFAKNERFKNRSRCW